MPETSKDRTGIIVTRSSPLIWAFSRTPAGEYRIWGGSFIGGGGCREGTAEGDEPPQDFYHPKWRIFWNRKIGNQRRRDTLILLEADRHIRVALGRCQPSCHRITPRRTRPVSAYLLRLVVASKHLGRAVGALEPFYCLMRVIVSVSRSPGDSMGALRKW